MAIGLFAKDKTASSMAIVQMIKVKHLYSEKQLKDIKILLTL